MKSLSVKNIILSCYRTFKKEAALRYPIVSFANVKKRMEKTLGVSKSIINRTIESKKQEKQQDTGYKQKYKSYDLPDSFDMDLLKRRGHEILARNEYLTITKLHKTLTEDGVSIKKYVLLKCLKSCGFKFG